MMAEKDEELSLFLEMRRREKEENTLLVNSPHEFETPLGSKPGTSPVFNIPSGAPARKTGPLPDDFLSSEGDKNDYEWTIPGNLRPLMTNVPASSMYSVRTGHTRGRPMNASDTPLATSSNASSEISVCNNNGICLEVSEREDDACSERGCRQVPLQAYKGGDRMKKTLTLEIFMINSTLLSLLF
ncbi:hypothetical protein F2Q69_00017699 [Brassica cretica]|uniref:Uncharacterized protein n=1 Tax=Brassica cretica TaxID=69181 RepID=A0A8S9R7Q8_BRACR|nr:hypothetical protein F2Q69_00017699 [Brassica cretica]